MGTGSAGSRGIPCRADPVSTADRYALAWRSAVLIASELAECHDYVNDAHIADEQETKYDKIVMLES